MSLSFPLVPCGRSLFEYPLPSLVTGQGQVLLLSGRLIFLQTRPPSDSSRSLRRIRLLLSRRQPRRYWPCVCTFSNAVLPRLTPLLQGQMVREWIFSSNLSGPSLYLVNNGAGSSCPREGLRGYVILFLVRFAMSNLKSIGSGLARAQRRRCLGHRLCTYYHPGNVLKVESMGICPRKGYYHWTFKWGTRDMVQRCKIP